MQHSTLLILLLEIAALVHHTVQTYPGNFALSFDGVDDVVQIAHVATDFKLLDQWTVEVSKFDSLCQSSYRCENLQGMDKTIPWQ